MRNPHLIGKIILSTALLIIVMGMLSSTVYSNFQGFISASQGQITAVPLEIIEGNKLVDDLSQTSPPWRRKLSKHIFINIEQELQTLEQQLILHDSDEGKRLIEKAKISLQRMIFGKQKFVRTGREASLAPFYKGRTVLEYNLWKLKGLIRDLKMDPAHTRGLFRVYALMNKWLVYVAHREINARRKGTLDASPQTQPMQTGGQGTEEFNASFPQISDIAKITEQDIKEADKAISQQPAAVQNYAPDINSESFELETLESPEPQIRKDPQPNLMVEEDTVSPQNFEEGVDSSEPASILSWMLLLGALGVIAISFLIFPRKRKSTRPLISPMSFLGNQSEHSNQNTSTTVDESSGNDLVSIDDLVAHESHDYVARQVEAWSKGNETEEPATDGDTLERHQENTADNVSNHIFIEPGSTRIIRKVESNDSKVEESTTDSEMPEGIPSQITVNMLEDDSQEDKTFQLEGLTQELEILHAEKEELTQGMENILAENDSLTEQMETFYAEKEGMEKQLEVLRAEKEELTRGLESILAENDSLTEKLETVCEEKESFEKQLEALHFREEELTQELKSILIENDSLTKQMEVFQTEKEDLEEQLETLRIEKEGFAQKLGDLHAEKEENFQALKNKLMESNSLTEKLEAARTEKDGVEKQLEALHSNEEELVRKTETLHAEKEELAQELKSTHEKNHSLTEKLETSRKEKESLETRMEGIHSREEKLARNLEETLSENDSLTEKLETSHEEEGLEKQLQTLRIEKEELTQELKILHSREEKLARNLEGTLSENSPLVKQLRTSHEEEENKRLKQEQKSTDAKLKAMTETLESTREKNKALEKEQENIHAKIKTLTQQFKTAQEEIKGLTKDLESTSSEKDTLAKKLKTAQKKNKTITKQKKDLTNQLEIMQTENTQIAGTDHNLTHELETLSAEAKDLKEKLDSTYFKNEALAPEEPEIVNTIDLSFDHDTPELMDSQADDSAMDDETTEDMSFSILNSARDIEAETLAGEATNENQDIPSDSLPGDQQKSQSDVILLQTILKAAKDFRSINKRLYKIAETRLAPSIKDGDSKEDNSKES